MRTIFLDMPLESIHKFAFKAAQAARCAGEQGKYWEMHDRLFQNQTVLEPFSPHAEAVGLDVLTFEECLASGKFDEKIRRDMNEARKAGVTGTPAFMIGLTESDASKIKVLVALKGAKSFEEFKAEIDALLEQIEKGTLVERAAASLPPPPPALPRRRAVSVKIETLAPEKVEAMQDVLTGEPEGMPAWIVASRSDPNAVAQAEDLARVFASAGWKVAPVGRSEVNVKPGVYLFAGEEEPPAYLETIRRALESAGFSPSVATGYKEFYAERIKTQSGFRGFPFVEGQTFVLVVGRHVR